MEEAKIDINITIVYNRDTRHTEVRHTIYERVGFIRFNNWHPNYNVRVSMIVKDNDSDNDEMVIQNELVSPEISINDYRNILR